ncbi:MAG: hypothetical protein Fur0018_04640 [Anaerolineales bacterium]
MAGNQERYQKLLNQGHSAAWEQDWAKAAEYYRQALEEIPDSPQGLISLGLALFEMQNFKQALKCYADAARLLPNDPVPLERMADILENLGDIGNAVKAALRAAELYARSGDIDKAIDAWGRVTRIEPEYEQAHSRLALVFEKQGRRDQAVAEYIAVASLQQHRGEAANALRTVQHALEIAPGNLQAQQAMHILKENRRLPKPIRPRGNTDPLRVTESIQLNAPKAVADEKTEVDPINEAQEQALQLLASLLFEGGDEGSSSTDDMNVRGLQAILQGHRQNGAQVDQTRILLHISRLVELQRLGNYNEATGELERALSAGLEHPAVYFDLGWLQYKAGRLESALRNVKKGMAAPQFTLAAYLISADIYYQQKRFRDAAIAYLEALKVADAQIVPPKHAMDLQQLYVPLIESQANNEDEQSHERLCANVRDLLLTNTWRARLREARMRLPQSSPDAPPLPLAEILTAASSGNVVEALANIQRLMRQGFWRSAMDEAFWALQHAPTYLPLHTHIGDLLSQQGYIPEAIAKFQVVARTHSVRGEPQRAVELLERITILAPLDVNARKQMIEQLLDMGEIGAAIEQYISMGGVHYNRAELDQARNTYMDAFRLAQQYNLDSTYAVKILYRMADIDMQSLDWRRAQRVYEQIRSLAPNDIEACLRLIDLNLRLGQESQAVSEMDHFLARQVQNTAWDTAIEFLQKLLDEQEAYLPALRRIAELYRRAGKTEQAIETYDKLADRLLDAGDNNGAIAAIESLLKLNPPNADQYQAFLEQLRGR